MKKIDRLRNETYSDMKRLLKEYKRCALIRPTGFGKTGLLTRLFKEYKNVIYLYPAEIVRTAVHEFYGSDDIHNVTFITYNALVNMSKSDMKDLGYVDLIIADECHRLGADKTYKAINKMLKVFKDVDFVGATATPDRMDLVDEISDFFDNHVVFEYTLHDAFKDGILKKPYYCYCSYGLDDIKNVEKEARLEVEKMDSGTEEMESLLRSRLIEISNLQRMDKIIKENCDKYSSDKSYMKFIVFFCDFNHIKEKSGDVVSWFSSAYPSYTVNSIVVNSETKENRDNVYELSSLTRKEKTIDLVFCVDMMNMGYHVNDLTGIVMYRGTSSGIIFSQQLGRALSSGSSDACIVFDIVDNIHREAIYDVLGHTPVELKKARKRYEKLKDKLESCGELTDKEQLEYKSLVARFENSSSRWWTHANDLVPEDLIAVGHEASYRELIAKTVAEPISMRCRQAWKRWVERGGNPNPMTRANVLGQKAPDAVPLSPFCELKNVSVEAVLREMGI